jgi:hypothetical protein
MSSITISEERTAAGFWRFPGATCELRIAANQSFRNSDGELVPRGLVSKPNTCLLVTTCTVNDDLSVSIPAITELCTTDDSIDLPTATFTAALFPRRSSQRQMWPDEVVASGFAIYVSQAPTCTWTQIVLRNLGAPLIDPPDTWWNSDEIIRYVRTVQNPKATTVISGTARLDVPAVDSSDPEVVGSNSPRVTNQYYVGTYASFAAAISAIGSTPATLVIDSSQTVSTSLTVPSNVTLRFTNAGALSIASGQTVTINGPIQAGPVQIFSGSGIVRFSGTKIPEYYPQWWGVTGDDSTDDTTSFQAAIDALPQHSTLRILPGMRFLITAPLRIWTRRELNIIQTSATYYPDARSWIDYTGSDGTAAVQIYNSVGINWDGLKIITNRGANVANTGIDIDQFPDGTIINGRAITGGVCSNNTVQNMSVNTDNNGVNFTGIRIAYTSENNCESMLIKGVNININGTSQLLASNANRGTAFKVGGGGGGDNAFDIRIKDCNWNYASYGVVARRGGKRFRLLGTEGHH